MVLQVRIQNANCYKTFAGDFLLQIKNQKLKITLFLLY